MGERCSALYSDWLVFSKNNEIWVSKQFGNLGEIDSTYPYKVIVAVLVFALICGSGILVKFDYEYRAELLWTPDGSEARQNLYSLEADFGPLPEAGRLLFVKNNGNILTLEGYEQIWETHERIIKETVNWYELCQEKWPSGICRTNGALQFFFDNRTLYNEFVKTEEDLLAIIGQKTYPNGEPVSRVQVFGGYTLDVNSNMVIAAEGINSVYYISATDESASLDWQERFLETVGKSSSPHSMQTLHLNSTAYWLF